MKNQEILWYNLSISETLAELKTSSVGLKFAEVIERQKKYGPNELPQDKRLPTLKIFLRQFSNVLMLILIGAALLSVFFKHYLDASVIATSVLLNIAVGFFQENKAEKALEKLRGVVLLKAKVIRDEQLFDIDASELVPGDIIEIQAGDQVPADARLIEVINLETAEAILTGESINVLKEAGRLSENSAKAVIVSDQRNMIFKGTLIVEGKGRAVVTQTGIKTEIGKIATLLKTTEDEKTPLQKGLSVFSQKIGIIIMILALFIIGLGIWEGKDFLEIFLVAVAVSVSAIPEGLLIAITVILVIGMQRILKKDALVKKLVAAETLGSTSVVCVDKTGTLTEGIMRVEKVFTAKDEYFFDIKTKYLEVPLPKEFERLIEFSYLCNNAVANHNGSDRESWQFVGTPTEKALLEAAFRFEIAGHEIKQRYPRVSEKPFDSFTKTMTTVHEHGQGKIEIRKGAPEKVIAECEYYWHSNETHLLTENVRAEINKSFVKYSLQGRRLIAVSYRTGDGWVFLGGFVIQDPVRESVPETVRLAHRAGLRVVMITGDGGLTARTIAKEIGLKVGRNGVLSGEELDALSDLELEKRIKDIVVYARVTPTHKIRIVQAWQRIGEVVAMTGDGVNDAPALKAADIGIAVGSASDVTRETADLIILKSDFSVIIEAIRQGRMIFQNIRKVMVYLLTDSFSEVVLILGSLILRLPLAVTAVQVLWINLVTDGFTSASLTAEKSDDDVMNFKPRRKSEPILDRQMKVLIFIIAGVTDLILLFIFFLLIRVWPQDLTYVRSIVFMSLGMDSLFYVFSCKSLGRSLLKIKIFDNIYLVYAVIFGIVLQVLPLYIPFLQKALSVTHLGWKEWALVAALVVFKMGLIELIKYIFSRQNNKNNLLWEN